MQYFFYLIFDNFLFKLKNIHMLFITNVFKEMMC
jgi:hypothetical protein